MRNKDTERFLREQLSEARERIAELETIVENYRLNVGGEPQSRETIAEALLNSSLQAIYVIDISGTILAMNDKGAARFGCEATSMLGRCLYDFMPPDVAERRRSYMKEVIQTGQPLRFQDQREGIWLDNSLYPVLDSAGQTTKILIHVDNITGRKQMEEELQRSRAELEKRVEERTAQLKRSEEVARGQLAEIEAYYNLAPVGLGIIDRQLTYVKVNQKLAEMNGISVLEHIGRPIWEVVPRSGADWFHDIARGVLETGEPVRDVEKSGLADAAPGIERTMLVNLFPLKDPKGQLVEIGIILEEITEKKRLEKQLRQSQKMEAMGTLSTGIAHDFNNILTAILGFTDLSYDEVPAGSKVKRYLGHVLSAANRGKDLVTQILSFSRRGEEELRPTLMAPIVKESVKMLRASLPKNIEIRADITLEPTVALADPTQIQQIIMNLGTNAGYAMWEQGGLMAIELSCVTVTPEDSPVPDMKPGPYIRLSVVDNGTGMEKDIVERAFDPFFTTKRRGEGTGLGLWVVHSIVHNHNGFITIKSDPGKGSTVDVFLPRTEEQVHRISRRSPSGDEGYGHVLVVDDETEVVELEKIMLERLGYVVTAVSDSLAALDLFSKNPDRYDLVLTDHSMPGMTGIDLARELTSVRPNIPVLLITGYRDALNAVAAHEAGVGLILAKPMTRGDLSAAIKQLLAQRNHRK